MIWLYVILLVAGAGIFAAGFFIPDKQNSVIDEKLIKELVDEQVKEAKKQIEDAVDDAVENAVGKAERGLERVSNDKIMAVNEYSDTVLEDINKNHKEVVFLYDMLNEKHETLISVQSSVQASADAALKAADEARKAGEDADRIVEKNLTLKDNEETAPVEEKGNEVADTAADAVNRTSEPKNTVKPSKPAIPVSGRKVMPIISDNEDGNKNELILKLHNEGKSNIAIAKELSMGVGEVNLVVALYRQGQGGRR